MRRVLYSVHTGQYKYSFEKIKERVNSRRGQKIKYNKNYNINKTAVNALISSTTWPTN